ncbi:LLM class flavin-dependent oxidoreductase [Nocardia sp. SYP-A9097]|uniref:LLM class flavin-dependent oxidoreductase n=1 Tax=Nocardia sp. SYP-A9097 TaxID=2663237 RepID=UPI00129AA7D3|nr:LLM class flavin-dependent oxidoreductase [Nocardia sp. SYP-A9097]MRH85964.1 LLM class flavin-dependent oxidoreductase [Nocardia sp. SYP-A9097]
MPHPAPLLLGLELSGTGTHPASWRRPDSRAEELFTGAYWADALRAAEDAGIDLAFLPDSFALQSAGAVGRLDAIAIAARAAAVTHRIGLIPQAPVTHTEPFHLSKAIASLDFASHGRAGWETTVSADGAAKLFGRKPEQDAHSRWFEADEAVEVIARLWDSWEDDAEVRDTATGRFIDRDRLHYIDFVGDNFSVKGPSITPRPPQGQPLVAVRAADTHSTRVAVHRADLIRITAPDLDAAAALRTELRAAVAAAGRDPNQVRVLLDIDIHLAATADEAAHEVSRLEDWAPTAAPGTVFHIGTAAELKELLARIETDCHADGVVLRPLALAAALTYLGAAVDISTARTLRERLGLPRPVNRYAHA